MLAATLTGLTEYADVRIEKPISAIMIKITGAAGNFSTGTETVTIKLENSKGGQKVICVKRPLADLFEISAQGEGAFTTAVVNADYLRGMIKLNSNGAPELGEDTYWSIDLANCTASMTIKVYGIESNVILPNAVEYQTVNLPANQATILVNVENAETLALEASNTEELTLNYKDGRSVNLLTEELEAIMVDNNDIVDANDAKAPLTVGFKNLFVLDVTDAVTAQVTAINSANSLKIYVIKPIAV